MDKRAVIIGTFGAGMLGLALVVTLSWLLSPQPRGAAIRGRPSSVSLRPGLDTGLDAIKLAEEWDESRLQAPHSSLYAPTHASGSWIRLRGIDLKKVPETRQALHKLRADGLRTCVFLRRSVKDWKVAYLPYDLRETYQHGRQLGAAFGDLVDAWEVDNEPDLGFVPESAERYTAFLKATYLGLKDGQRMADGRRRTTAGGRQGADVRRQMSDVSQQRSPLVIMGSLGLPPGPWLERFAANDGFAYTDGYNYHYYGYAEDFTGVYQQHESAVADLAAKYLGSIHSADSASSVLKKDWPVFLTEVGYGMLGKQARDTKEGRLRQWRWFKSVGEQVAQLRIEGAMAFYLLPYLEYDTSEYGMTVPAKQETEKAEGGNLKAEGWTAGGIEYSASDFAESSSPQLSGFRSQVSPSPWMKMIGTKISGNEITPALAQWLAGTRQHSAPSARPQLSAFSSQLSATSRSWSVATTPASPVVIDFLPGEGLSPIKRYHGSFVTGTATSMEQGANRKAPAPPLPPRPSLAAPKPGAGGPSATPRREEFIIQVRTQNGNLYEVYPTRQAAPEWQHFMEPQNNFTMSFYGRAELPWRFTANRPASLVIVMYPKQLPAVFEFRHPMLTRLGEIQKPEEKAESGKLKAERSIPNQSPESSVLASSPQLSAFSSQVSVSYRYGRGKVILYNFSDRSVAGRLFLPGGVTTEPIENTASTSSANSATSVLHLLPNERREIPVSIQVAAESFTRVEAPISFIPEDTAIPPARFLTTFMPDIGGMPATVIASLLNQQVGRVTPNAPSNHELTANRPRATEEAPMIEQGWAFAQAGAQVSDTFTVTVTSIPPGKPQRIEVEIPWPDGLEFPSDAFLSLEYRLRP